MSGAGQVAVISTKRDGMKVETAGKDANNFKHAEAAMRGLIKIFLVLDFALACYVAVKIFHL